MTAQVVDQELSPLYAALFEHTPVPTAIFCLDGSLLTMNAACELLFGMSRHALAGVFNLTEDPQTIAQGLPSHFQRAIDGEVAPAPPLRYDTSKSSLERIDDRLRWVQVTFFGLRDADGTITHIAAVYRDVTSEIQHTQDAENARQAIAAQRETISALSTPVIQVWEGILSLPLIGPIDSNRATTVTENLLEAIVRTQANCVILDITGVPTIDTETANHLVSTARACRLLGCEVVLVGVGPDIAQTLVQLGVDLDALVTLANLQAGIAWAFRRRNITVVASGSAQHGRST